MTSGISANRTVPRVFQPTWPVPDDAGEARMRQQERVESSKRVVGARAWEGARRNVIGIGARSADQSPVPAVGDLVKYNADATHFCDQPDLRTGRVMAVTDK